MEEALASSSFDDETCHVS